VDVKNGLAPGKSVDVSTTLEKHGLDWDGKVPVRVHVDRWNSLIESDEGNNIHHRTIEIFRV